MPRTVLITGSAGHLGRALRAAFEAQGDKVVGIDLVAGKYAEWGQDIASGFPGIAADVLICNAKAKDWWGHNELAKITRQCVVNIGSIYGALASDPRLYEGTEIEPTPAWYVAQKGAMVALTRHQAATLAPVRVNCVCPGGIFRGHSAEFESRYSSRVPLKRMATEDDIVGPVLFLASDAARYITGQVLMVDGGLSVW